MKLTLIQGDALKVLKHLPSGWREDNLNVDEVRKK